MGVIQVVLSPACLSATPDTALAQYLVCNPSGRVSIALQDLAKKRVSLETIDQKADERWSVVETVAQRTFEEVGIDFQRAVGAARLTTLWNVPCKGMVPTERRPTRVKVES